MPISILMPALSPTMTEGNLTKWLKKEGDAVKAGDVIAEIETDKATMEVESADEGILGRIVVPAGAEQVAVNTVIALLLEEGEDAAVLEKAPSSMQAQHKEDTSKTLQVGIQVNASTDKNTALQQATNKAATARIFASPLARRLADHKNIDLQAVSGSGPHGRIVKADVEKAASAGTPSAYGNSGYVDIPINNVRKVTAKRLTESKQEAPHFYLTVDCTLDALLKLRSDLNTRLEPDKLSVNDFIIRAVALSLIKVPEANVSWQGTNLRQYHSADISVAVAIPGGLVTPIVRTAQSKSLRQISREMKDLAERARSSKLAPDEFQGGTFTISNLGMYGIKHFSAIINPPQGCILAVGMGEQRPVIRDGQIQVATQMTCTLSVDHRAVDGAIGAAFLAAFKEFIEHPLYLLV